MFAPFWGIWTKNYRIHLHQQIAETEFKKIKKTIFDPFLKIYIFSCNEWILGSVLQVGWERKEVLRLTIVFFFFFIIHKIYWQWDKYKITPAFFKDNLYIYVIVLIFKVQISVDLVSNNTHKNKTKDFLFTVINEKEKQRILTYKKLEPVNVWQLCWKNDYWNGWIKSNGNNNM